MTFMAVQLLVTVSLDDKGLNSKSVTNFLTTEHIKSFKLNMIHIFFLNMMWYLTIQKLVIDIELCHSS